MPIALITGITGQTGGYLCDLLLERGYTVHGVVRDADETETEFRSRSPRAILHTGDLGDERAIARIVEETAPDAIFNLGGLSSVAQSWTDPVLTGRITGLGVAGLLDAAWKLRTHTARRVSFVQASSAEIFGYPLDSPQNEATPVRPSNPYGAAKAYAHHLVGVYRRLGLEASSCILYNHESPRRPETFVTRKITRGVAKIALGLETELVLGNLDAQRDWGWAPDYAAALAAAADGEPGDYVIATGDSHSVREFVDAAFAAAGITDAASHIRLDERFMRPQDAPSLLGDSSHAREALGWAPTVAFDEIVRRMVEADIADLSAN
jgi:GDPmannose 4,6-dehydratase